MKKKAFSVVYDAHLRHKSGARGTAPTATCTTLSFLSPRNSILQSAFHSAASQAYTTRSKTRNCPPEIVRSGSRGLRSDIDSISNLDEALGFYKQMVRMRPLPSVVHFTQLLGRIVKMKQYLVVISLYRDMAELGCIPFDEYPLCIVINCYCCLGKVNFGFSILGSFFKRGILPNTATFTTLLKGLFREHKIHEAQGLFKKIIYEKLCILDEITYGTVIDGLSRAGNTSMAIQVLRFMEKGERCRPHTAAYNTIIDGLCKDKMMDQALSLLHEMIEKGIAPDVITYNCLVQGLCNLSKWKDVENVLTEMKAYNIDPDVITFNILIDALCKEGQLADAEQVLTAMIEQNQNPTTVTYNALMDGYCLQGQMGEARRIFDKMAASGLSPDVQSHTILINGYMKKMKVEPAMNLFQEIQHKGLTPNVVTYNTVLQGLFGVGRLTGAEPVQ